jgi:16S rRNA (cytosine967-C5)-methyltransferase
MAQRAMLREVASVIRPGGWLVYATCSSEPEENEAVVDAFVSDGGFELARPSDLPDSVQPLIDAGGYLQTQPPRDGMEAFFAATMVRTKRLR